MNDEFIYHKNCILLCKIVLYNDSQVLQELFYLPITNCNQMTINAVDPKRTYFIKKKGGRVNNIQQYIHINREYER